MSKLQLVGGVGKTFSKVAFSLKKHSPEIMVAAGVVGTVASAVLACKATTKLSGILEKKKEQVEAIHYAVEHPEKLSEEYTEQDSKKDLAIVYTRTALDIAKLYAPSVILGVLSITGIITSHSILRKRNVAIAAAYATIDKGFKEYRGRVVDRFGKQVDHELRHNIKKVMVDKTQVEEDGSETVVQEEVTVMEPNFSSEYARFFDDGCTGWTKDPEYNLMFLKQQQNYANELLQSRKHLFLNEVYDLFNIPRTQAGAVVGWIYDEKNPLGDNYVDFGLEDVTKERVRAFVNGYERVILLDFNVDGVILGHI